MKKAIVSMIIVSLLLLSNPFEASASTLNQANTVNDSAVSSIINNVESSTVYSDTYDNPERALTNSFGSDVFFFNNLVTGSWYFTAPSGKLISAVDVNMTLQYRENFLNSWSSVASYRFNYNGGLSNDERNQHTFTTNAKGQYRVNINGTFYTADGSVYKMLHNSGAKTRS